MKKILYAITVCNELNEFYNLLCHLISQGVNEQDIFVLIDKDNHNPLVVDLLVKGINNVPAFDNIKFSTEHSLSGNFGSYKNNINKYADGYDYIFQLDADELPSIPLIKNLTQIVEANESVELFYIPRRNTVDGITEKHVNEWKWYVKDGCINPPDFQGRVYKVSENIKWEGKVHEKIVGVECVSVFEQDNAYEPTKWNYFLLHHKSIDKQEQQNKMYESL